MNAQVTAIVLTVLGVSFLGAMDGVTKLILGELPLAVLIGLRSIASFTLVGLYVGRTVWWEALGAKSKPLLILRGLLPVIASFAVTAALAVMPLADVTAVLFAAPLVATALSIPLLKEKVGFHRWMAVAIGFGGVILVLRPSGEMSLITLLPLVTATIFAIYQMMTRLLRFGSGPLVMLLFMMGTGVVATFPLLVWFWEVPDLRQLGVIGLAGLLYALAHLCLTRAFSGGADASSLTPFLYSQIIAAAVLGYLLFGELPDLMAWLGTVVIISSGLYVWYRETKRVSKSGET